MSRIRRRLPVAPRSGTTDQVVWFQAVTEIINGMGGESDSPALPVSAVSSVATKEGIGLGRVDNTSDEEKPVSAATQDAINELVDLISNTKHQTYYDEWNPLTQTIVDIDAESGEWFLITENATVGGVILQQDDIAAFVTDAAGNLDFVVIPKRSAGGGSSALIEYTTDPVAPQQGEQWILKTTTTVDVLSALAGGFPVVTPTPISTFDLSINTSDGIKRVAIT